MVLVVVDLVYGEGCQGVARQMQASVCHRRLDYEGKASLSVLASNNTTATRTPRRRRTMQGLGKEGSMCVVWRHMQVSHRRLRGETNQEARACWARLTTTALPREGQGGGRQGGGGQHTGTGACTWGHCLGHVNPTPRSFSFQLLQRASRSWRLCPNSLPVLLLRGCVSPHALPVDEEEGLVVVVVVVMCGACVCGAPPPPPPVLLSLPRDVATPVFVEPR